MAGDETVPPASLASLLNYRGQDTAWILPGGVRTLLDNRLRMVAAVE